MVQQVGERIDKMRWYSVLTAKHFDRTTCSEPFKREREPFLGIRFESTAAVSDSCDPQAEVSLVTLCN